MQPDQVDDEVERRDLRIDDCAVRVWTLPALADDAPFTFVLVSGIGVAARYWERLAPRLRPVGRVIALDLPGFGGVPHPKRTLDIGDYAQLVAGALERVGVREPVLIGHSMGTQVATEVAAVHPVHSLVLIGPVVSPSLRTLPKLAIRFLASAVREPGRVKALALASYARCGPRWFLRVLPRMLAFEVEEPLAKVQAPTLVVRGEWDATVPRAWVETMLDTLPDARAWEIPDAAHSVMHRHAEEVAVLTVDHAQHGTEEPTGGRRAALERELTEAAKDGRTRPPRPVRRARRRARSATP